MDYKDIIKEKLAELNLSELENVLDDSDITGALSNVSAESIISSILAGEPLFNTEAVIESVKDLFLYEMKSALVLGVEIVTISIVIGMLKSLSSSFGEKAVSNLGTMVCTCLIIGLCLGNFTTTFNLCKDAVNTMTYTMQILIPILIPLLIAIGGC